MLHIFSLAYHPLIFVVYQRARSRVSYVITIVPSIVTPSSKIGVDAMGMDYPRKIFYIPRATIADVTNSCPDTAIFLPFQLNTNYLNNCETLGIWQILKSQSFCRKWRDKISMFDNCSELTYIFSIAMSLFLTPYCINGLPTVVRRMYVSTLR